MYGQSYIKPNVWTFWETETEKQNDNHNEVFVRIINIYKQDYKSGASSSESNSAFSSFTQEPSRLLFQPDLQNNPDNVERLTVWKQLLATVSSYSYLLP